MQLKCSEPSYISDSLSMIRARNWPTVLDFGTSGILLTTTPIGSIRPHVCARLLADLPQIRRSAKGTVFPSEGSGDPRVSGWNFDFHDLPVSRRKEPQLNFASWLTTSTNEPWHTCGNASFLSPDDLPRDFRFPLDLPTFGWRQ